jgi:predicted O-linked N-acetylglucosamine transferase (SPINDLY family)
MKSGKAALLAAERSFDSGDMDRAERILRQLVADAHAAARAYELLAYICGKRNDIATCEALLLKAATLPDCSPEALYYLGQAQVRRGRGRAAVASFQRCLGMTGDSFEVLHELGVAYVGLEEFESALSCFERAGRVKPGSYEVHHNQGNVLRELQRLEDSLRHYDAALQIDPQRATGWADRAETLMALGRYPQALDSYDSSLALAPQDLAAQLGRACALRASGDAESAQRALTALARLPAETEYVRGHWLFERMATCRWAGWQEVVADVLTRVGAGERVVTPYHLVPMPAGPVEQLACARIYARDQCSEAATAARFESRAAPRRVRIGYFSTDFRNHATSHLVAGLLERHDRERFETFAFSLGPKADDPYRRRIEAAVERFVDVDDRNDAEITALARTLGIDIALDLNGYTEGAQPYVFARRAAPVQVNYLGFPGTMGCGFMDYIVADEILVRPDDRRFYDEKVIVLPGSYQPNDDQRRIADASPRREAHGLPGSGFVFACFNNTFKITPDVFDVWMRLLRDVPASVLWLLKGSDSAPPAIVREAQARGVDASRIVWAPRLPLADHLARHAHADLFLDTFHWNAHTTCSDALWAGLPVVTLMGPTFASRVGASLLHAVGLPELVTRTVDDYHALADSLARDSERLARIRARLGERRATTALFDTRLYAARFEAALDAVWERYRRGLAPAHLRVLVDPLRVIESEPS